MATASGFSFWSTFEAAATIVMSHFPVKRFEGLVYGFDHLNPTLHLFDLNAAGTMKASVRVTYSAHCFTESFDDQFHQPHHRYVYKQELRAFDLVRYECSKFLPSLISQMHRARVYRAQRNNYTYVTRLDRGEGVEPYSLFFTLKWMPEKASPTFKMYVQSAYLSSLKAPAHAQTWRFRALLGQLCGVLQPAQRARPKKKAP